MLLIGSLVGSLFLDDVLGERISNVVTIVTAIIGAVALFIQFKKDKEINQASFILEFSKEFRSVEGYNELMNLLEKNRKGETSNLEFEKNYQTIVSYMQWVETLASLVRGKVMKIDMIDDLLSYNVFLILNNKEIQEKEIVPCKDFYHGTYWLYENWVQYKRKNNLPIMQEETSLEYTEGYRDLINLISSQKKYKVKV